MTIERLRYILRTGGVKTAKSVGEKSCQPRMIGRNNLLVHENYTNKKKLHCFTVTLCADLRFSARQGTVPPEEGGRILMVLNERSISGSSSR